MRPSEFAARANRDHELYLMRDAVRRLEDNQKTCTDALTVIQQVLLTRQGEPYVGVSIWNGLAHVLTAVPWVVFLGMNDHLSQIVIDNSKTLGDARGRLAEMERGKHADAQDPAESH
jgi:hypothetical protein